ncbi:uncharacterized protein LOC134263267 [Saccostrea cucullata]|uniref:uncharacterized protein LOC134263267 n=1 Tax=Saccostrea cuccullata TaxID=36930 RepID=UPI002ED5320C
MKMQFMVLLVIFLETAEIKLVKTTCPASVPTIRYVSSCPSNEEAWKIAESKKNCKSLADIQKCVADPSKFKYHCLVNSYLNATLEVCAPIRFASGYCADFNTLQIKVTENYNIDCTKLNPACPQRYVSTDIYKYPSCYKLNENHDKLQIPLNQLIQHSDRLFNNNVCTQHKGKNEFEEIVVNDV